MQANHPLKIVFLAPFGIRPKGTVLARMVPLAAELQTLGAEVVIIAPPYTNPEDSGRVEDVRGVRLVNVRLPDAGKAVSALILAWRMLKAALAERPDLVHLFKPKGYGGIAAMLMIAIRRLGLRLPPVFVDTDDWEGKGGMNELHCYSKAERLVFDFQERWLLPNSRALTVASRELERMALAAGVAARRLLYLPNCVEAVEPGAGDGVRRRLGIPGDLPVLLLYTRFFEFNQEKLHNILAEIRRQLPQVRFLVVGKGRHGEEERLLQAAATLGFADVLHVAGWIEPAELPDYLAVGEVAIYPFDDNLVNRCKCPAKLTELLRSAVPVVADRVGQLSEYIEDGEGGILCQPDDWRQMASAAVELLRDPARRQEMGKRARGSILERFNWHRYATDLHDFYLRSMQ
jgi:glycosyltransferase involved in cell wall biosynthesis